MSTINLIRFSGRPVDVEDLERYETEFRARFDEIELEVGRDMLLFQERLAALDAELNPKYKLILPITLPKTKKAWNKLVEKYQSPILFARSIENPKELVAVIYDKSFNE